MSPVPIPQWNSQQVLPPIGADDQVGPDRSPYDVTALEFATRFCTSSERCRIVDGFLRYRAELRRIGVQVGFHWIDGSFTENVEATSARAPRDVDVVTFLDSTQLDDATVEANQALFDHDSVKARFLVDAYIVELNCDATLLVEQAAYWYGVWSHNRSQLWKGFLRIDFGAHLDEDAHAYVRAQSALLGQELDVEEQEIGGPV